jgi:hypothetical protein
MKTKALLLTTIIVTIAFFACTKKRPIGKWSDIIQLSGNEFNFKSTGDSVLIFAKGKWWGINGVLLDTNKIDVYTPGTDACNFTYIDSTIKIISKSCDTLFIKMGANNTNSDRTLIIGLLAGDYYGGIKITQPKN